MFWILHDSYTSHRPLLWWKKPGHFSFDNMGPFIYREKIREKSPVFLLVTLHFYVRKCLFTNYSSFLRYLIFWYLISMISTMFVVIWKCVGLLALLYYWLYIQWLKMTIISLIAIIYEAIYRTTKVVIVTGLDSVHEHPEMTLLPVRSPE